MKEQTFNMKYLKFSTSFDKVWEDYRIQERYIKRLFRGQDKMIFIPGKNGWDDLTLDKFIKTVMSPENAHSELRKYIENNYPEYLI